MLFRINILNKQLLNLIFYIILLMHFIIYSLEESTGIDSKTSNTDKIMFDPKSKLSECTKAKEGICRTHLLMSLHQMMIHNYPLPTNKRKFTLDGFRFTKSHYLPVTDESPMYAVDCEMCYTSIGRNELTRVSIINEQLDVSFFLYDYFYRAIFLFTYLCLGSI